MTIWKFPIELANRQKVLMPEGANILCVQMQGAAACLWAVVQPTRPKSARQIRTFGTGDPVDEGSQRYIGTYQTGDGAFVWHVFEEL